MIHLTRGPYSKEKQKLLFKSSFKILISHSKNTFSFERVLLRNRPVPKIIINLLKYCCNVIILHTFLAVLFWSSSSAFFTWEARNLFSACLSIDSIKTRNTIQYNTKNCLNELHLFRLFTTYHNLNKNLANLVLSSSLFWKNLPKSSRVFILGLTLFACISKLETSSITTSFCFWASANSFIARIIK